MLFVTGKICPCCGATFRWMSSPDHETTWVWCANGPCQSQAGDKGSSGSKAPEVLADELILKMETCPDWKGEKV